MQKRRRGIVGSLLAAALVLLFRLPHNARAQECDPNCKTNNCSPEGICICDIPSEDSILSGDRKFQGGVFCNTSAVMCDGTNSFWCESGGMCNELVQGKNYTCTCPQGLGGLHCNLTGERCNDVFCFNGGICRTNMTGSGSCGCPPEYSGSKDCSLATLTVIPSDNVPSPATHGKHSNKHFMNQEDFLIESTGSTMWWGTIVVVASIVSIFCLVALGLKYRRWRSSKLSRIRFDELRQVQMHDGTNFYDDDDDHHFRERKNGREKSFP